MSRIDGQTSDPRAVPLRTVRAVGSEFCWPAADVLDVIDAPDKLDPLISARSYGGSKTARADRCWLDRVRGLCRLVARTRLRGTEEGW